MTRLSSPLDGLDPILNAPKRLAIMAVLAHSTSSDFAFLRQHLGVSDSDLSKQAAATPALRDRDVSRRLECRGAYRQHRAALRNLLSD